MDLRFLDQARLTSPKNTTSLSQLTGSETMIRSSSSATLTTDSTTPPSGSKTPAQRELANGAVGGDREREDRSVGGEREREDRSIGGDREREDRSIGGDREREDRSIGGELVREDRSIGEKFGQDKRPVSGEQLGDDKRPTGGELGKLGLEQADRVADGEFGQPEGLANDDKMSDRDAKTSELVGMSTAEKLSSVADSVSLLASEISLTAKLSGSIGMTIGLAPVLTGVDSKGTVKDRLNSIEPDKSTVRNSAIPNDNLEKKPKNNEKINNTKLTEKTNCSQSKNCALIF